MESDNKRVRMERRLSHFAVDMKYFVDNLDGIKEKYGSDQYVAIYHQRIIGSDGDRLKLLERFGGEDVYIDSVNNYIEMQRIPLGIESPAELKALLFPESSEYDPFASD